MFKSSQVCFYTNFEWDLNSLISYKNKSFLDSHWCLYCGILEYEVREKPTLSTWMQGGLDYIMLQYMNIDGIRTIGSVLGQSIALDYYVRQVGVHQLICDHLRRFLIVVTLLLISSAIPGWWNGCGVYRHQSWNGKDWNFYNGEEKAFPTGWQGKF